MKKYPLIDAAKMYCALLVVLVHTLEIPEGHYWGSLLKASLASQAVPFFFITSGFFFWKKWHTTQDKTQFALGYVKRLLVYYAIWVLITVPEILLQYLTKYAGRSFLYITALIIRRVFFAGYSVYWYLLVMAESACVIGILLKKDKQRILYILAGIGLLLDLAYHTDITWLGLGSVNRIIYQVFSWNNNFLMKGVPFMAIGCYLAQHCEQWALKTKQLSGFYLAVFLIHAAVFAWVQPTSDNPGRYLFLYPLQAVLLFLIAISTDHTILPDRIIRECRPISSAVYCVHCFFIYYVIDPFIGIAANTLLRFAAVVLLSLGLYWIVKRSRCKPLIRLLTLK